VAAAGRGAADPAGKQAADSGGLFTRAVVRFGAPINTRFADGPWLTKRAMQWFWDGYLPDPAARKQPTATPLNASLDQLAGLPEALVIVDENDVLRDEGEAYARRLSNAGVRVTSTRYNGTIHDFVMLNALADTPAARGAIEQAVCALKATLG
jgi:acetyl esterase